VDVASHGVRSVILEDARPLAVGRAAFPEPAPPARRPATQWWEAFLASLVDIPADLRAAVEAVAFTGVRGAVVGLDRTGAALTPGYPDFDAEAVPHAVAIEQAFGDRFLARTGCPAFPLAGFAKLMMSGKVDGDAAFLGPQDYLAFRATGERRLSVGTALRWGVLDSATLHYADDLLAEMGIATETLPRLAMIGEPVGATSGATAEATGIREGTPVIAAPAMCRQPIWLPRARAPALSS
jgi:sugar (pentulose or hexulose) kinase